MDKTDYPNKSLISDVLVIWDIPAINGGGGEGNRIVRRMICILCVCAYMYLYIIIYMYDVCIYIYIKSKLRS